MKVNWRLITRNEFLALKSGDRILYRDSALFWDDVRRTDRGWKVEEGKIYIEMTLGEKLQGHKNAFEASAPGGKLFWIYGPENSASGRVGLGAI